MAVASERVYFQSIFFSRLKMLTQAALLHGRCSRWCCARRRSRWGTIVSRRKSAGTGSGDSVTDRTNHEQLQVNERVWGTIEEVALRVMEGRASPLTHELHNNNCRSTSGQKKAQSTKTNNDTSRSDQTHIEQLPKLRLLTHYEKASRVAEEKLKQRVDPNIGVCGIAIVDLLHLVHRSFHHERRQISCLFQICTLLSSNEMGSREALLNWVMRSRTFRVQSFIQFAVVYSFDGLSMISAAAFRNQKNWA